MATILLGWAGRSGNSLKPPQNIYKDTQKPIWILPFRPKKPDFLYIIDQTTLYYLWDILINNKKKRYCIKCSK